MRFHVKTSKDKLFHTTALQQTDFFLKTPNRLANKLEYEHLNVFVNNTA